MSDSWRAGLREVVAARSVLDSLEAQLVVRARRNGCTWAELAQDLELSAGGARRRHLAVDPVFAGLPLKPPSIDEYHTEFLAAMRARGISLSRLETTRPPHERISAGSQLRGTELEPDDPLASRRDDHLRARPRQA